MIVSLADVKEVFQSVIDGKMTREDADLWASCVIDNYENGNVEFSPIEDRPKIWSGIKYLLGVDLLESPSDYVNSIDDIKHAYRDRFGD